jgi:glycosyltransferase involved in cell wall biosynthesis
MAARRPHRVRVGQAAQMSGAPQVSVVMSVCNGAATLRETVASVLAQEGVDLEFVIVDDGSTDGTVALLQDLASADGRIRMLRQENRGITLALIRGCAAAKGEFVARQDCGDVSLPGRLAAELQAIQAGSEIALVSCGTSFVGPGGEKLYDNCSADPNATAGLLTLDLRYVRGPSHHGSTMFRRDLYLRLGGYRKQFYFAQDLDLWIRLAEGGRHEALPAVLYEASFAPGSISGRYRDLQFACAEAILECARLRRSGEDEAPILAAAERIVPQRRNGKTADRAAALYFVGACLRNRADPRARQYFRDAWRANPLHWKSAVRLLLG